jgi:hypothetical protein
MRIGDGSARESPSGDIEDAAPARHQREQIGIGFLRPEFVRDLRPDFVRDLLGNVCFAAILRGFGVLRGIGLRGIGLRGIGLREIHFARG